MVKRLQKKKRHYVLVGGQIAVVILSLGHFENPPNGFTGAPGESLCTECHTLNSATQNGSIIFSGFPATINANQTYVLTITVSNPNGVADYAGFQTVILDSNNENAGTLSSPSPGSVITEAGDRTFHEHNPAQMFGMSNAIAWTVSWTAPEGSGPITYYAAANIANGNDEPTGDRIVTKTGTGNLFTPIQVAITDVMHVSCFEGMDGAIIAQANFGNPGYTYQWSNGASGQVVVGLGAGTYEVTVTDSGGATATASAEVTEPPFLQIVSEVVDHVSCTGENDGLIILELDGGVPPYSGTQDNYVTFANLTAGMYDITIMDANGCLLTTEYFINEPAELEFEFIMILEPECAGESSGLISVVGTGGTGAIDYIWSNGSTSGTIQNLNDGVYSVTITDDNGCTAAETLFLDEPNIVQLILNSLEHVSCAGEEDGAISVVGSGGSGVLSYEWSNGLHSSSITGLDPGNYSVTVSDENGCTDEANYIITEPPALTSFIIGSTQVECFDDATGTLLVTANGGLPGYQYSWSNGSTNAQLTGLDAGTYQVTVSDAIGCLSISTAVITQPTQLIPNATSTDESAPGEMDGTATASPTGGTGIYSFRWSNGDETPMISDLAAGTYSVTVTDDNNCSAVQTVAVSGVNCTLLANVSTVDARCYGEASGSAQINVTGSIGAVDIHWSTGDITPIVEHLVAGSYSVAVNDSAGCVVVKNFTIDEPQLLSSICSATGETMEGSNDGSIACIALGGVLPYQFLWSNGDTSSNITGLAPGLYSVTITDDNGCTVFDSAFVNALICMLQLNLAVDDATCYGENSGSASAQLVGGTSPLEILWSNGVTGTSMDSAAAGLYHITVTDADGCVIEMAFEIGQPDELSVVIDTVIQATQGTGGAIQITIMGGVVPYTTIWTQNGGLVSSDEDLSDLSPGDYNLTIMDANDCVLDVGPLTVPVSTGIAEMDTLLRCNLWPNPARDFIMLSLEGNRKSCQVEIYSPEGILRSKFPEMNNFSGISDSRIDINNLACGLYYLRIADQSEQRLVPFVKI